MQPAWVKRQVDDFVTEFATDHALIGIRHRDSLLLAHLLDQGKYDGQIEPTPDLAWSEGFVWRPADRARLPQLWLDPRKSGYRDAFERFAKRELGAPGLGGANVHIDHVFPKKAGAMGGLGYVRMLAAPPESNMAAGRTLEKAMVARNALHGPRKRHTRDATYFSVGKATGFAGYTGLPDADAKANAPMVAALMAHLRAWGLPPGVLTALDERLTARTAGKVH